MRMLIRMNDRTKKIIKMTTRCIFINYKDTFNIGVARPYQLIHHLNKVTLIHKGILIGKVRNNEILKLKRNDRESVHLQIRKR